MVSGSEVNPVNQRYRALSNRYKAGWTFHRFMLGLRKFFGNQDLDDRTSDFRALYERLREVSQRLNDLDMPRVVEELSDVGRRLDVLIEGLEEQDAKISPSLVRLFFQRVKAQDERILIELVRFYLEVQRGRDWRAERTDKVDFLLSRLGRGITDPDNGGDRQRLNRVLAGISEYVEQPAGADPQKVANRLKLIQAVRSEVESVESFDELTERDLVAHYRNLKHGLGALIFEKSVLPMIVGTNLIVSNRVQELTDRAQEKIFAEYEKVSGLEERGLLGGDLAESVSALHSQVGSLKRQIDSGTLRISAVAEIQNSVQGISQRIGLDGGSARDFDDARAGHLAVETVFPSSAEREVVGSAFEHLVEALHRAGRESGAARELDARLLDYRLGDREIEAYTKVVEKSTSEPEFEGFVLAAASLRWRIRRLVQSLHDVGGAGGAGGRKAILADADSCLRLGDLYLRRFDHFFEMRLTTAQSEHDSGLQSAKMHLMREYSGLWLMVRSLRVRREDPAGSA